MNGDNDGGYIAHSLPDLDSPPCRHDPFLELPPCPAPTLHLRCQKRWANHVTFIPAASLWIDSWRVTPTRQPLRTITSKMNIITPGLLTVKKMSRKGWGAGSGAGYTKSRLNGAAPSPYTSWLTGASESETSSSYICVSLRLVLATGSCY